MNTKRNQKRQAARKAKNVPRAVKINALMQKIAPPTMRLCLDWFDSGSPSMFVECLRHVGICSADIDRIMALPVYDPQAPNWFEQKYAETIKARWGTKVQVRITRSNNTCVLTAKGRQSLSGGETHTPTGKPFMRFPPSPVDGSQPVVAVRSLEDTIHYGCLLDMANRIAMGIYVVEK